MSAPVNVASKTGARELFLSRKRIGRKNNTLRAIWSAKPIPIQIPTANPRDW
jgi:hypothetical protein